MIEERLGVDTEGNTEEDESGAEESAREVGAFPEEDAEDCSGGERRRIGDWDGKGEWGVGEYGEECGGGGEVDEERDRVLPDEEELEPVAQGQQGSLVDC